MVKCKHNMSDENIEQNNSHDDHAAQLAHINAEPAPSADVNEHSPSLVSRSSETQGGVIKKSVFVVPSPSRKKHSILKVATLLSFSVVTFSYLLFLYLGYLANNGTSGTEFFALIFWPVLITVPFLAVVGMLTGVTLTVNSLHIRSRVFWGIISTLLLLAVIHQAVGYIAESKESKEYERQLGRDETVSLISNCEIESFTKNSIKEDNYVDLQYKNNYDQNDEWQYKPYKADGNYYPDYVVAAKDANSKCGEIIYHNDTPGEKNDPAGLGHRWLGVDEAKLVLMNCEIKTYNYGPISLPETVKGTKSGIALIDYGWVKHLYVYPQSEQELMPVVIQAKEKCGSDTPQIWNGSYERL